MPEDAPFKSQRGSRPLDLIDGWVAARLRQRRRELGLDPQLLDLAINASPGTVAKLEAGGRPVGASQLYRLAKALDVEVTYFFAAEPDGERSDLDSTAAANTKAMMEARRFVRTCVRIPSVRARAGVCNLVQSIVGAKEAASTEPLFASPPKKSRRLDPGLE